MGAADVHDKAVGEGIVRVTLTELRDRKWKGAMTGRGGGGQYSVRNEVDADRARKRPMVVRKTKEMLSHTLSRPPCPSNHQQGHLYSSESTATCPLPAAQAPLSAIAAPTSPMCQPDRP